ncbi:MAG: dTDP-4-dehydrorhamnose 3,5-epimerase [Proteobacteria bacterium]|nr:dTDP-4-dehydrorhamnose 3,5-epimerase [Pseudomonadota bacterium]
MRFEKTVFEGVYTVHPERHADERGYFVRAFCEEEFSRAGLREHFPQTSFSFNVKAGTVRGMHFQRPPNAETKLVRCVRGGVLDVVVDLRPDQSTYCQWRGFSLSAENGVALYIPEGFAHGFQTLEDNSELAYAITPSFVPGVAEGIRWNDPMIDVKWPLPISTISERDTTWTLLGGAQ